MSVYLLDTNCKENASEDREITHRLYGGDAAVRIRQEMILGLGGVRALRALGMAPAVWHMNEGHAAFLILELVREVSRPGWISPPRSSPRPRSACSPRTRRWRPATMRSMSGCSRIVSRTCITELGVSAERLFELGKPPNAHAFNMTNLALNGARRMNGVSRIHGAVSSRLCADHWPEVPPEQNPVGYVTNGVHVPTFLSQIWSRFFDGVLGAEWRERLSDKDFWYALTKVPDADFWDTAQQVKARMLEGVRARLRREYRAKDLNPAQLRRITRLLDPEQPNVLTLGFARRFATYKRASLMLRDRERLLRLISSEERPVLFLFAGKAHPADHPGQQVLREIKQLMLTPEFAGNVVFLEDYDIQLARWLVTGVDVWLNNPVAPLEASGTSGIKAAVNGRLNVSILDGWWAEAFDHNNGWGIPPADAQDADRRDALDSAAMLDAIEEEVVPLYYSRNQDGYSPEWVRRCKRAMMTVIPHFNMGRVVQDYARGVYYPAAQHHQRLMSGGLPAATRVQRLEAAGAREVGRRGIAPPARHPA